jgi:IS605 OrfB family transposase
MPSVAQKRAARRKGETVMRTISIRVREAVTKTGEAINEAVLKEHVASACQLASEVANQSLTFLWNQESFDSLSEKGGPSMGYRAVEKIAGVQQLEGKHLDSRYTWLGEELAGRISRQQKEEAKLVAAVIAGQELPNGSKVWLRNTKRSLKKEVTSFFEWKPEPPVAPVNLLPLSCADRQVVRWSKTSGNTRKLHVKLPTTASPQSKEDYVWHILEVKLPPYVQKMISGGGELLTPTLRLKRGRILADLVIESPARPTPQTKTGVGVDWGERRHLSLSDGWLDAAGQIRLSGRPQFFDAKGLQAKQATRRRRAGKLKEKRDHLDKLLKARPNQPRLIAKRDKLEAERVAVWGAYNRCSSQWAHAAARWVIEHMKAIGADTVFLEDLKSLEARFRNHGVNGRINHQLRGAVHALIEHKAKQEGLKVKYVQARGTSSTCPLCQKEVKHHKSCEDKRQGRGWGTCKSCHYSRDRDVMAAQNILVRGLRLEQEDAQKLLRPRRVQRPALTAQKRVIKEQGELKQQRSVIHAVHAKRVQQGCTVRPQSRPRAIPTLSGWSQRGFRSSCSTHRDLHGLSQAYTGRVRASAARPSMLGNGYERL